MAQSHIAEAAAVRLTMRYPFWAELFYSMTIKEVKPGDPLEAQIKTEATDGRTMWINTAFFTKLKLDDQVNELVHEISHKMLIHPSRQGHRDQQLWNVACDYAINEMMVEQGHVLQGDWLRSPKHAGMLAEAIYADINKEEKKPKMPEHRTDIKQPEGTPEEKEALEQEIQATVDRAIQNAKARGDLPKGIEDNVALSFRPVSEPWYNRLHRFMQELRAAQYDWARLNRRTIKSHGYFAPLHYSAALGEVVIWIDASGSCFEAAEQAKFADHVNAILAEAKPSKTIVYYFDSRVYAPTEFDLGEVEVKLQPKGGGGTSFKELFTRAEEDGYHPDVGIVLTDMMGPFPAQGPDYPVIWADVYGYKPAPFGETIRIE